MKQANYCQNGGGSAPFRQITKQNESADEKNGEMTSFLEVETDKRRTGCGKIDIPIRRIFYEIKRELS